MQLLDEHKRLGISEQIDYEKFYLYSIIAHSTAIEGSTVTEIEAQLLFDEGITSNKRSINEQLMNLDLKVAYEFGMKWIKSHPVISVDTLIQLSSKVMARTGTEYSCMAGTFSSAKGELRKLNVTAGFGGRSYMSYLKVPQKLADFCSKLNQKRKILNKLDISSIYELTFWAHYELVTIHPWVDGNGRMSRLLMNLIQFEFGVLPNKVLASDKTDYIQALVDSRDADNSEIFVDVMTELHIKHLKNDIHNYLISVGDDSGHSNYLSEPLAEMKIVQKKKCPKENVQKAECPEEISNVQKKLSERQMLIIQMIGCESLTLDEMSKRLDVSSKTVQRDLDKLRKDRIIERVGGRTYGQWKVVSK